MTQDSKTNSNADSTSKIKVLVAGFPSDTNNHEAIECMESICEGNEYSLILRNKKQFRGFAFILFKTHQETDIFLSKEHRYEGKLLDCRFAKNHDDYIDECLEDLKKPKKVFAKKIPKSTTKCQINDLFSVYGNIKEVILISKKDLDFNTAFINFDDYLDCKNCVDKKFIELESTELESSDLIEVSYAKPKFSSLMLFKIDPELRAHLEDIKKQVKEYDPAEFEALLNSVNSKTTINPKFKSKTDQSETSSKLNNNIKSNNPKAKLKNNKKLQAKEFTGFDQNYSKNEYQLKSEVELKEYQLNTETAFSKNVFIECPRNSSQENYQIDQKSKIGSEIWYGSKSLGYFDQVNPKNKSQSA